MRVKLSQFWQKHNMESFNFKEKRLLMENCSQKKVEYFAY